MLHCNGLKSGIASDSILPFLSNGIDVMPLPNYHQDPTLFHINTTPHHAYFIPFATQDKLAPLSVNNLAYLPYSMVNGNLTILRA